jgi:hypothetical protein
MGKFFDNVMFKGYLACTFQAMWRRNNTIQLTSGKVGFLNKICESGLTSMKGLQLYEVEAGNI